MFESIDFSGSIPICSKADKNKSALILKLKKVFLWLNKKMKEGAEIHNRAQRESDRRYANNFYHIRGVP